MTELEERLRRLLGLTGYEARAYLALLHLGEARPLDVAREAGIPSQRIYDVLHSLEDKGLVTENNGVYKVIEPTRALEAYANKIVARAVVESEEVRRLARELEEEAQKAAGEYVTLVRGLDAAIGHAIAALGSCRGKPVFMLYKAAEKLEDLWPLLRLLLEKLSKQGGAIAVVPKLNAIPGDKLEEARKAGVDVVESPAAFLDMMVSCDTVIIGLPGGGSDVVAVHVRSREFAQALRQRILAVAGAG